MIQVLLITPAPEGLVGKKQRKFHRRFPPLSMLVAARMLKDRGYGVCLADMNADPEATPEKVLQQAQESDLVVMTTNPYADWQCPSYAVESMLAYARQLPGQKLAITGNHGTHYPGSILQKTGATFIIREEEESGILEIAQAIAEKKSLSEIGGISYRKDDGTHQHNPKRALPPMTDLPDPDYELVDLKNYYYELLGENFALLEASRGCPFSCNFCNLSMFQKKYRKTIAERVKAQIVNLVEKRGCRSLYVFDLEFTVNRKMAMELSQFLLDKDYKNKYGFKWACQTRADSVDDELCMLMRKSGCELIHFGVEAGNEEILKATNKKITKDGIRAGMGAAQRAGIKTAAFFIFGHPGEEVTHYKDTLDFALELNPTYASFHPMLPFPGSPQFEKTHGVGPYWEHPISFDMTYFSPEQEKIVTQFVRQAYLRFYLRPKYIWNQLTHGDWALYQKQLRLFRAFFLPG